MDRMDFMDGINAMDEMDLVDGRGLAQTNTDGRTRECGSWTKWTEWTRWTGKDGERGDR